MSFDLMRLAMKLLGNENEIIEDKYGTPNIMVKIPKMKMRDLIEGGSNSVHPAFIVNGVEKDYIYISKFLNTVSEDNKVAVSWPLEAPANGLNYDEAKEYCERKGKGWHLMTNAEWSLIALLAKKAGKYPNGNNNYGKDIKSPTEQSIITETGNTTYTGSGPVTWSHDGTKSGIYDLNGNLREWVSGLRLIDGEIQVIPDNNVGATGTNTNVNSTLWKVIQTDGDISEIGDPTSLKYDYTEVPAVGAEFKLTSVIENKQKADSSYGKVAFENLQADYNPEITKALALAPVDSKTVGEDAITMKNSGERMAVRGGKYNSGKDAGIFSLDLTCTRKNPGTDIGFRCCYIPV